MPAGKGDRVDSFSLLKGGHADFKVLTTYDCVTFGRMEWFA